MAFLSSISSWCSGPGAWHGASGMGGWLPFHFGGIFQIALIGLIIFFVIRMTRKTSTASGPSPHDIIKRRYASGEIDKEAYDRMRDELK